MSNETTTKADYEEPVERVAAYLWSYRPVPAFSHLTWAELRERAPRLALHIIGEAHKVVALVGEHSGSSLPSESV